MVKLALLALALFLLLPSPAGATFVFDDGIYDPPLFTAQFQMTKVLANQYQAYWQVAFDPSVLPQPYVDEFGNQVTYRFFRPGAGYLIISDGVQYGSTFESAGAFTVFGFPGDRIRVTIDAEAFMDRLVNGVIVASAGAINGHSTLTGEVPTFIGQTTTWAVTPEPSTWLLLGLGLFSVPLVRSRRDWTRS